MRELYPPVLPSYVPAFDCNEATAGGVRVYFQLSHYNTISQIAQAQVVVRFQTNNASALADTFYNDIVALSVSSLEQVVDTDYPYYITIPGNVIKNGFKAGYIYKVQIRLSTIATTDSSPTVAFINANLNNFSEWSTVCLLKSINKPTIDIKEFDSDILNEEEDDSVQLTLQAGDSLFTGRYILAKDSDETPKTWRMRLYDESDKLLRDSGEQVFNSYDYMGSSTDNIVVFEHNFKIQLEENRRYSITVNAESKNGYALGRIYSFYVTQNITTDFYPTVVATMNDEEAYVHFTVEQPTQQTVILTLRRSSVESNFTVWEDLTNVTINNAAVNVAFDDFTVESGIIYQYGVQVRDINHKRGVLFKSNYVMGDFQYSYLLEHSGGLTDNTVQLKLTFNHTVSSFSNVIVESKMDTIGSKYPFISRNGNTYYKTFPITGLISYHMDDAELFTSRRKTYGDALDRINSFNESRRYIKRSLMGMSTDLIENTVTSYDEMYDFTYERVFREQVMDFLYNNKPKLFKSATEGNILVKLMEESLTPIEGLGRLVYEFSATAYEIDDISLEKLNQYDIQTIEPFSVDIVNFVSTIGQLNSWDNTFPANVDIHKMIRTKHHINETFNGTKYSNGKVVYLKITFESPPYLINIATKRPASNTAVVSKANAVMGWLINYGSKVILVTYPNNVYELKDPKLSIPVSTKITFPKAVEATIDYIINIESEDANQARALAAVGFKQHQGQIYKTFKSEENFVNAISYRYLYDEEEWMQRINNWHSLDIEAEPGTVVFLQQSLDEGVRRFVINFTGVLHFEPEESSVLFRKGFFYGQNIIKSNLRTDYGEVNSFPENPYHLDYCTKDDQTYIFYNGEWRQADYVLTEDSYDIVCPVDGIVNYYVTVIRGEYAKDD